ncbi:hypothetical protein ACHQM5_021611 [Ranunculus cassubicifolius]
MIQSDDGHDSQVLDGNFRDSLRFSGVHRSSLLEWCIAIIGGTGKYEGANGYVAIKSVTVGVVNLENTT